MIGTPTEFIGIGVSRNKDKVVVMSGWLIIFSFLSPEKSTHLLYPNKKV